MWVHLAWQVAAFILSTVGLASIIVAKVVTYSFHMYSVHAYVGVFVLVCYYLQVRLLMCFQLLKSEG